MMNEWSDVIERAEADELPWDVYFEPNENGLEVAKNTIPGRLVQHVLESTTSEDAANRTLGLLTTFVARRSLVCWFLYCADEQPLFVANRLLKFWLRGEPDTCQIDEACCAATVPTENGVPITDCRWSDTFSASNAIAYAARFACTRLPLDAIISLSNAFVAFDVSPVGSVYVFRQWLAEFAAPCAKEGRAMTIEEEFALADFEIPEIMHKRRER